MRCRSHHTWVTLCVVLLGLGTAAFAQPVPGLRSWLETDRQSYGARDSLRVALCLGNDAGQDIGLFLEASRPTVTIDGTAAPTATIAPAEGPTELIVPSGGTRALPCTVSVAGLGLTPGSHQIVAAVQPVDGEPIRAEGAFVLLPLRQDLSIGDLLGGPNVWQTGDLVELKGEYRANKSRPLRPLDGTPARRLTDWILGDETGEIYVRNRPVAEGNVPRSVQVAEPADLVDLNPGWSYGKRVVVRGRVVREPDGSLTLDPLSIFKWQSDRGALCVLETAGPTHSGEHAGELMMRMIFKNDTKYPIRIASPAGYLCDFVVEREGVEVWRWSRHRWTGSGIRWTRVEDESWKLRDRPEGEEDASKPVQDLPLLNIPPDNSIVRVAYWPLVDNDGKPVPAGVYSISAILSHRVFTYAVPVAVGASGAER